MIESLKIYFGQCNIQNILNIIKTIFETGKRPDNFLKVNIL